MRVVEREAASAACDGSADQREVRRRHPLGARAEQPGCQAPPAFSPLLPTSAVPVAGVSPWRRGAACGPAVRPSRHDEQEGQEQPQVSRYRERDDQQDGHDHPRCPPRPGMPHFAGRIPDPWVSRMTSEFAAALDLRACRAVGEVHEQWIEVGSEPRPARCLHPLPEFLDIQRDPRRRRRPVRRSPRHAPRRSAGTPSGWGRARGGLAGAGRRSLVVRVLGVLGVGASSARIR